MQFLSDTDGTGKAVIIVVLLMRVRGRGLGEGGWRQAGIVFPQASAQNRGRPFHSRINDANFYQGRGELKPKEEG
jgi:hypothetical protein